MSDNPIPDAADPGREELLSMVFAQMVMQQANLAMMLLGKAPHPQSGETTQDLEGARMFIDQLEMLEAKTKGNLSKEEAMLLKQSLMSLQLAFVEAVESPASPRPAPDKPAPAAAPGPAAQSAESKPAPDVKPAEAEAESRKKFSRKY